MVSIPYGKGKEAIKALYKALTKVSIPYGKGKVRRYINVYCFYFRINSLWER